MEILSVVLSVLCLSSVDAQIFRNIRVMPMPFQSSRFFRDPSLFHSERTRWSWSRCFQYPWMPRCQRLFARGRTNWRSMEPQVQQFPAQNMRQPPINRQQIRFPQQTNPGNLPFLGPSGFRQIPDVSQIQPVCNITCAPGLLFYGGECQLGLDSLCTPACPNGYICHHGHCDSAPCFPACSDGLTCRDGKCLDINRCEPACCPGQVCHRGVCLAENAVPREPVCNPACPPGYVCHDGHCDRDSSPHLEVRCPETCPPGYVCHNGHCDKTPGSDTCSVPCIPPEVCHNGHCEIDRHTLTHLTVPNLDHSHDPSQPGASGTLIPATGQEGHHDHHHEGPGSHSHQQVWGPHVVGGGNQITDFSGGRRTTPGAFGSQLGGFTTRDNSGINDIHARIATEFRQSNIPDSQLGVDLGSFVFQDPVTGQGVNINP